jgi:hypothetical protein
MRRKRSLFRLRVVSATSSRFGRANGVSLVETLIAAAILVFGLLSIAQLLGTSVRGHQLARNSEEASRLVIAKIEQLEKLTFASDAAIQITPGGAASLDANVTNYFDAPITGFTRRWSVAAGPTSNTRLVTIRVVPTSNDRNLTKPITVTTVIRSW